MTSKPKPKTSLLPLLLALVLSTLTFTNTAQASKEADTDVNLCPPLDPTGHAASQEYVFSDLNWTLTHASSGNDFDVARVAFSVQSDFDGVGSVRCDAEGREFSEEYLRQLAGETPVYGWFGCEGGGEGEGEVDVKTEFRLVWWNTHLLEVRQTWVCPATGLSMRATGHLTITNFTCTFSTSTSARTSCLSSPPNSNLPFSATIVSILSPPPCTAATPDWTVTNLTTVNRTTTFGLDPGSANISFHLLNHALDGYSPRLVCEEKMLHGPLNGVYTTPYKCAVFEANEGDVPVTRFDWIVGGDGDVLRVNQTWFCDGGGQGTRFQSIGDLDVKPLLDCSSFSHEYEAFGGTYVETFETCDAKADFEIKGQLQ
ncbi:hypothetical protein F4808DRAFT_41253 [Astrocystis sublimbata]|nr:hypothetical protein F4808DRAFT_41253 [Astrocystis sublimbata]